MADVEGQVRDEELDAQAEARRRAALAQIRQYPDAVLRLRAHDVTEFDEDLRGLADRMTSLMLDASGVGLAANQAGVLRRIFVFQPGDDEPPRAVVNPRLVELSDELVEDEEGCLSLGPVRVPVERHRAVTLVGQDLEGEEFRLELEDLAARVAQHELDHLDGVLILERTTPEARRQALAILRPKPILVV
jgi:peptide deformylase